jgi:mono/diheme cytochrome c family protein
LMDRPGASQPPQSQPKQFWQRPSKGFWQGFISGVFALLIVGGLLAFFLSPELLKHRSAFPGEEAIGQSRVEAAIDGSYKDKTNPVAATADNISAGRTVYNTNCAFCHGVTGAGDATIGQNMFPKAADLLGQDTVKKTDGELYWIMENGLAFVGMPSFKSSLSADDLWKATLYIRQLQKSGGIVPIQTTAAATTTDPAATTAAATTAAAPATATAYAVAPTTAAPQATTAAVAPTTAPVQTTAASGNNSSDLAKGLAFFQQQGCSGCHGGDKATGQIGPALNDITFPFSAFLGQVRSGSGVMPAFPSTALSDADAQLIFNYLKSLQS